MNAANVSIIAEKAAFSQRDAGRRRFKRHRGNHNKSRCSKTKKMKAHSIVLSGDLCGKKR
jgi:hypothetical protein